MLRGNRRVAEDYVGALARWRRVAVDFAMRVGAQSADDGRPVTVVSIRDLLSEAVAHHAKIIAELERERMTIFTSTA